MIVECSKCKKPMRIMKRESSDMQSGTENWIKMELECMKCGCKIRLEV